MITRGRTAKAPLLLGLGLTMLAAAPPLDATRRASAVPARPDDRTVAHVLNRIAFGPAPGDVARVKALGLEAYIDEQLSPARGDTRDLEARLAPFKTLSLSSREIAEQYSIPAMLARREAQRTAAARDPGDDDANGAASRKTARPPAQGEAARGERLILTELSAQKILRAAYSDRQLEEVLTDFWFNHFNVFAGKGPTRLYLNEYEREAIRPHVLGKFRDLLGAVAASPAMLFYLDNWQNAAAADAPTLARPGDAMRADVRREEVQARMLRARREAARRGVPVPSPVLTPDGPAPAARPAASSRPRGINENYARELMELHTLGVDGGYTQRDVQEVARAFTGWTLTTPRQGGRFRFDPRMHDAGEKVVLGHRIAAGGGQSDGVRVLDLLAAHPSTARFIATRLVRRFVADTPPPSLVDQAAQRFRETGGDLREVVRVILTSPEFFAPDAYRAKVKTPFEFVVSAVRATAADAVNPLPLVAALRDLGMPLYMCQPPTGYADQADAWVNTGALLNRMNFAVALTGNRLRGVRMGGPSSGGSPVTADALVQTVLASDIAASTSSIVARAQDPAQSLALLLGSPEFQRR